MTSTHHDESSLRDWILDWLAKELKVRRDTIRTDVNLQAYRIDSINAIMLVGDLEDLLGRRLSPTLLWDFPTVDAVVGTLVAGTPAASEREVGGTTRGIASAADLTEAQVRELLGRLDELSEREIESLLARMKGT